MKNNNIVSNKEIIFLPSEIEKEYTITSLLSLHENAVVFSLEKKKQMAAYKTDHQHDAVLKIFPAGYYDEELLSALQSLHRRLLLPEKVIKNDEYIFALYHRMQPFSVYLSQGVISFSVIMQWIKDMDEIVSCLHQNNIIHGDISLSNIYLNEEGRFYLGDFSSARIIHSTNKLIPFPRQHKVKKTGATFPMPGHLPAFYQDSFSFLTILSHLAEKCQSLSKEEADCLFSLLKYIEDLMAELMEHRKKNTGTDLSFHQICQNLLSKIEIENMDNKLTDHDFLISDLEGLTASTKTINRKKSYFCSLSESHKLLPVLAFFFCILVLIFAIFFYISSKPEKKTAAPVLQEENIDECRPSPDIFIFHETPAPQPSSPKPSIFPTQESTPSPSAALKVTAAPQSIFLDISYKKYQKIPSDITVSPSVKVIFAEQNLFKNLSPFHSFSQLEELYLDKNLISNIEDISSLKNLSVLCLSGNRITDVSALKTLTSLTILDLSCQKKLSNLSSLGNLKKLNYLVLTETNISKKEIQYLQNQLPGCTILH